MGRPHLVELRIAAPAEPWRELGLWLDEDGACTVGGVRIALAGGEGGISGWTLAGVGSAGGAIDGLETEVVDAPRTVDPTEHPLGAVAVDHVVVATPDIERTVAALTDAGLAVARLRDAEVAGRQVRQAFLPCVEALVEVVGPPEPACDGPAAFWGLTLAVADLDGAVERLGDRIGPPRDAVQPGRRIATVRPEAGLGVRLALMTPREPGSA